MCQANHREKKSLWEVVSDSSDCRAGSPTTSDNLRALWSLDVLPLAYALQEMLAEDGHNQKGE